MAAASGRVGKPDFGTMFSAAGTDALMPFLDLRSAANLATIGRNFRLTQDQIRRTASRDEWYAIAQRMSPAKRGITRMPDEVLFLYGTPAQQEAFRREHPEAYLREAVQFWKRFNREREQLMPIFSGLNETAQREIFLRTDSNVGLDILVRPLAERQHVDPGTVLEWLQNRPLEIPDGNVEEFTLLKRGALIRALPEQYKRMLFSEIAAERQEELRGLYPELRAVEPLEDEELRLGLIHLRREREARLIELHGLVERGGISSREFRKRVGPHVPGSGFFEGLDVPTQRYYFFNVLYSERWLHRPNDETRLALLRYPDLRVLYLERAPSYMSTLDEGLEDGSIMTMRIGDLTRIREGEEGGRLRLADIQWNRIIRVWGPGFCVCFGAVLAMRLAEFLFPRS